MYVIVCVYVCVCALVFFDVYIYTYYVCLLEFAYLQLVQRHPGRSVHDDPEVLGGSEAASGRYENWLFH